MFQTGDLIIYGSTGVCEVTSISPSKFPGESERLYYTLAPRYGTETIYIPVDSSVFMRHVLTREQAEALIAQIPDVEANNMTSGDHRIMTEQYEASLRTHDCVELLRLIKTAYLKTRRNVQSGRKPGQTDQRYLKRAETQLYGELAVALGIEPDEVKGYIERSIGAAKKKCAH